MPLLMVFQTQNVSTNDNLEAIDAAEKVNGAY